MTTLRRLTAQRALLALGLVGACLGGAASAQPVRSDDFGDKLIQLGAGPPGGTFLPLAAALCDALNERRRTTLVRCVPLSSAGSVFNIRAVANGSLQMGLAQEDLVARHLADAAAEGSTPLRTVALMYPAPIAVIVRRESGITTLAGLRNGVVNKGFKGSGIHANATLLLDALGLADRELKGVTELPPGDFERAFCEGRVDVVINALAQPASQFERLRACGGEFLDIEPAVMARMQRLNPMLRPMEIPAGLYGEGQQRVATLGVRTVLIAGDAVDDEAVYRVAIQLFKGLGARASQQPYLKDARALRPQDLTSLAAPLHRGATRALKETAR